jgi:hypothetical protein
MKTASTVFTLLLYASVTYADYHTDFLKKILKMDDLSAPSAVASLEEVLSKGGDSILPCAAAQALFLMNTPESKEVLKKWLKYPRYDMDYSIDLAFNWGMHPMKRDQFIRAYHLNSTSNEVKIVVKSEPVKDTKKAMEFTISLVNVSDKALRFYKPRAYLGKNILLVSEDGEFMGSQITTYYSSERETPENMFPEVAPGKSINFSFKAEAQTYPDSPSEQFRYFAWFNCGDFSHCLFKTGKFKVYARYDWKARKNPPYQNIWTGRLISEPIEITIPELSEPIRFPQPPSAQKSQKKPQLK